MTRGRKPSLCAELDRSSHSRRRLAHSFTILIRRQIEWTSMAEPNTPLPLTASRSEQIFPTLTSAQIARVAKHGRTRIVRSGQVLVQQGARASPFVLGTRHDAVAGQRIVKHQTAVFIDRADDCNE